MKLSGLKPTHVDIHTGIEYAKRGDTWYFLNEGYGVCPSEMEWGESANYNSDSQDILTHLIEIES